MLRAIATSSLALVLILSAACRTDPFDRLTKIDPSELSKVSDELLPALQAAAHTSTMNRFDFMSVAMSLLDVNGLFTGNKFQPTRAAKYSARLRSLPYDAVLKWGTAYGLSTVSSALMLMQVDPLYSRDVFQGGRFQKALAANPATVKAAFSRKLLTDSHLSREFEGAGPIFLAVIVAALLVGAAIVFLKRRPLHAGAGFLKQDVNEESPQFEETTTIIEEHDTLDT
jgi:hypothetical protein